ncbi:MAG: nucleotide pyrophosphohydrolase [Pirellulaceae bacterium]
MADPIRSDDSSTTLSELRNLVREFVEERDWRQFHSPKNLSMSLAIEAAELMEHFQWLDVPASREAAKDPARLAPIGEELADVLCYAFALANELGLDISTVVRDKMAKNAIKYPADEFRGIYGSGDRKQKNRG